MTSSKKKKPTPFTILVDTREQMPLDFSPFAADGVSVETGTVWPGDYTIKGWEKSIAFERKSVSDLIGTLKSGYVGKDSIRRYESRFDLELEEFERHYDRAFVIIEPDSPEYIRECGGDPVGCDALVQIIQHWYRSAIPPASVLAFIRALSVEYGCHIYLAVSREDAAHEIVETAKMYIKSRRHVIHRGKMQKEETAAKDAAAKVVEADPW